MVQAFTKLFYDLLSNNVEQNVNYKMEAKKLLINF